MQWHWQGHWQRIQRGDGTRLGQPERSAAVNDPFHVLGCTEEALGGRAERGEFAELLRVQNRPVRAAVVLDTVVVGPGHQPAAGRVDLEMIGIDCAGDHVLSGSPVGVDHRLATGSGHGIGGEQDARRRGFHKILNDDGETHLALADPVGCPVHHRPVAPERRPAAANRIQHPVVPGDVHEGVLLTGKAGERQVLGRGGGTHGHGRFAALPALPPRGAHGSVGCTDGGIHLRRHRSRVHEFPGLQCKPAQVFGIPGIEALETGREDPHFRRHSRAVGGGGQAKSGGHRKPGSSNLAEIQRLPAHAGERLEPKVVQLHHEPVLGIVTGGILARVVHTLLLRTVRGLTVEDADHARPRAEAAQYPTKPGQPPGRCGLSQRPPSESCSLAASAALSTTASSSSVLSSSLWRCLVR